MAETKAETAARLKLEAFNTNLAREIKGRLPPGTGFALLTFDLGDGGAMTYASSGDRQDMIRAMRELIGKLEMAA